MQNQLNELKRKMLEFFQQVKSKINHRKSGKVLEEKKSDGTGGKFLPILGSILDGLSDGCHHLIQEGAKLVTSGQDVLAEFEF